ncbi:hypothetical protein QMK33_18415 [Hymenobacter sp. H14-R3]|uniref:hypothetical protein n=1 Tax=Hymenobacter sp. H14-R3 TaxID=3046308 RepID=UPI0024BA3977|nr:hypothetical protein [Hymenobacter sp. H14-R3]MDJ0367129.1 hypothetical protein [Hymenobacter sp. H14-R3]
MKNLRKFRRFLSVSLLCTGLFGMASANTPVLGAAINSAAPAGGADNMVAAEYAYNIGYIIGALLNLAGYAPQAEAQLSNSTQLPVAKYQATDFSTFD